jgi:hypothetical protein
MTPRTMEPMETFDPTEPALLHDQLNDEIMPWIGEQPEEWRKYARKDSEGVVAFEGHLFDGWAEPLGG